MWTPWSYVLRANDGDKGLDLFNENYQFERQSRVVPAAESAQVLSDLIENRPGELKPYYIYLALYLDPTRKAFGEVCGVKRA